MSNALQENVLTLLCFDADHASIVSGMVTPDLFESKPYRDIADRAIDYSDRFGKPPGNHLPDLFTDILEGSDEDEAELYADILHNLFDTAEGINSEYVLSQVTTFVRQQRLKSGITEAVTAVKDGDLELAESVLTDSMSLTLDMFDPGVFLKDLDSDFSFLDDVSESFKTGISELDYRNFGPSRKELHVFMGLPGRGKTWWLVNLGKWALAQRLKVLHITLEMSEAKMTQRYMQSLFSISKREQEVPTSEFKKNTHGQLVNISSRVIKDRPHFEMPEIRPLLKDKLLKTGGRLNLLIKQFPPGSLTVKGIRAYLDGLERIHNWIPDLLILDYADDMKLDASNLRVTTGRMYKDLRGVAVERNIAVATATQANRHGVGSKVLNDANVAEDYSKIHTADCVISYNQTPAEKMLGLARLFVVKGRNDADGITILINQAYGVGQFALDSTLLEPDYWEHLEELTGQAAGDQEEAS